MPARRRWLALQALVSVALLALIVRRLDLAAFRDLFLRLPIWFYFLSLAVILAGQVAFAWRWGVLLAAAGVRVGFRTVVQQYFIGTCLANFFPSTVGGDLARVYYLGRDHGYRPVTASVVLDRMLGIALQALSASAAMWLVPPPSPLFATARVAVTGVALASVLLLFLAVAGTGGLPQRVAFLGDTAVRIAGKVQRLRLQIEGVLRKPQVVAQAAAVVAVYFVAIAILYVLYVWLATGRAPSLLTMFAVATTTAVLSNIPVSLNGIGLREQLHAALLVPLGVRPEVAVGISLLLFAHVLIASVIGLAFWLRAPALPANLGSASEML